MPEQTRFECPHDKSDPVYACAHMFELVRFGKDQDLGVREHVKWFLGTGCEYALLCPECAKLPVDKRPELAPICRACFKQMENEGGCDGRTGEPQFLDREKHIGFDVSVAKYFDLRAHSISDIQPLYRAEGYKWAAIAASGALLGIPDRTGSKVKVLAQFGSHPDCSKPLSMRFSPDERFVALAETYGQSGCVLDLTKNSVTLKLSRDGYHCEHSIFPIQFFESCGRLLLVHGTGWNRLDVSDPATGELLTQREFEKVPERKLPPHYLDYFHGLLTPSPGGDLIVDNGWIWHPVGVPVAFSLGNWLSSNVWESEDGPSRKQLDFRYYSWPTPVCWIDDETVALSGFGEDDAWIVPAAQLVSARTGNTVRWFAGPRGEFFFDEYLFASSEDGFTAWDILTGERILNKPSFHPTRYHRVSKEFLSVLPHNRLCIGRVLGEG